MSRQEHTPPHGSPQQLVNQLFSAGLGVHQAMRLDDHDVVIRCLKSVLDVLDEAIATVLHTGLAHFPDSGPELDRVVATRFPDLARGMADGFDVATYLHKLTVHGTDLPDVHAAAITVGEAGDAPGLTVTSPQEAPLRELCLLRPSPTWDTYLSGALQTVPGLATDIRWPLFAARANAAGHEAVHTVPLRRRTSVLGVLTLFRPAPGALSPPSDRIAHGLADLATIGVLLHHAGRRRDQAADLVSERTRVHQAEGVLAERHHVTVAEAAAALARHARRHHRQLPDVARSVLDGTADPPVSLGNTDGDARTESRGHHSAPESTA
jgi:hypothetical protein